MVGPSNSNDFPSIRPMQSPFSVFANQPLDGSGGSGGSSGGGGGGSTAGGDAGSAFGANVGFPSQTQSMFSSFLNRLTESLPNFSAPLELFGSSSGQSAQQPVELAWGRNRYRLPLSSEECSTKTLNDLKDIYYNKTGVPRSQQKVLFSGAVMRDNKATLSSYGIGPGSKILMMGSTRIMSNDDESDGSKQASSSSATSPQPPKIPTVQSTIDKINDIMRPLHGDLAVSLYKYTEGVDAFESKYGSNRENGDYDIPARDSEYQSLKEQQVYLSEMIMQILLKLDGVECPEGFEEARTARRAAVRECNRLSDSIEQRGRQLTSLKSVN
ncbi:hypothetical protein GQ42DRAFT_154711 [Ramicandelaber brevisporus]|nr:hypothetical protein GQ42DRAFT_154711 [Ramicandelaber brevisporus]